MNLALALSHFLEGLGTRLVSSVVRNHEMLHRLCLLNGLSLSI